MARALHHVPSHADWGDHVPTRRSCAAPSPNRVGGWARLRSWFRASAGALADARGASRLSRAFASGSPPGSVARSLVRRSSLRSRFARRAPALPLRAHSFSRSRRRCGVGARWPVASWYERVHSTPTRLRRTRLSRHSSSSVCGLSAIRVVVRAELTCAIIARCVQ